MSKERILVVDDTEDVLRATRRFLTTLGFIVTVAKDADVALANDLQDFDLVVTDFNMPGRNGIELARAIKQRRPDLPVVLYTASGIMEYGPADALLQKPVSRDEFVDTICRLIPAR